MVSTIRNTRTLSRMQNIPLASKRPHAPVTSTNILRIQVVQIPPQAAEPVLAGLHEHVKLSRGRLVDPVNVALHILLRVARDDNGRLGLEEQGERLLPLVRAGRVAQAGVEHDEAVEIGVIGVEVACLVDRMVVVDNGADLHCRPHPVLDNGAKGIRSGARGQWELVISVGHALGADEDEMDPGPGEDMGQLDPDVPRKG